MGKCKSMFMSLSFVACPCVLGYAIFAIVQYVDILYIWMLNKPMWESESVDPLSTPGIRSLAAMVIFLVDNRIRHRYQLLSVLAVYNLILPDVIVIPSYHTVVINAKYALQSRKT